LDLDANRAPAVPKDAATLLVLRSPVGAAKGIEVFCVRRHAQSAFMGGVVVFPGGKLDVADQHANLVKHTNGVYGRSMLFSTGEEHARGLAVCACREALEEAAILPASPSPDHRATLALRDELAGHQDLAKLLDDHGLTLDTRSLVPFARWVTPTAEARRYDARFFMTTLPTAQRGHHDDHETTSSLWASPNKVLEAYAAGQLFLAPPTIRALEILEGATNPDHAMRLAEAQSLLPICPELVTTSPATLALPGDPAHSIPDRRVSGPTRFVWRDGRFVSEE
jgi:8-oxo-dGTP pyrophosphatase MutT (NUDIX family)